MGKSLVLLLRSAYTKIKKILVSEKLIAQAITKAPSPNKLNFQILQLI